MPPHTVLLGTAQDGGIPHVGCRRPCCRGLDNARHRLPCCLGIVDPETSGRWMIDCTPEFPRQLQRFDEHILEDSDRRAFECSELNGILLTHAHVGHYTGLIFLGAEAMATHRLPLFVMPKMGQFLEANEPWKRLVNQLHVELQPLADGKSLRLNDRLAVTPLVVPHRDEFSETVAFIVSGPNRSALFLPDIDDWERWPTKIEDVIAQVDVAYLDGTFFDADELPQRKQDAVPHPRIADSLRRFAVLPDEERNKIRFLHFNHTNPAHIPKSAAAHAITAAGMHVALEGESFAL